MYNVSLAVSNGDSANFCGKKQVCFRNAAALHSLSLTVMEPLTLVDFKVDIIRSSAVFPAPEGPMITVNLSGRKHPVTFSNIFLDFPVGTIIQIKSPIYYYYVTVKVPILFLILFTVLNEFYVTTNCQ